MGEASEVVIRLGGVLDVTGEVIVMWIILAAVTVLSLLVTRNLKERPGPLQNMLETGVDSTMIQDGDSYEIVLTTGW